MFLTTWIIIVAFIGLLIFGILKNGDGDIAIFLSIVGLVITPLIGFLAIGKESEKFTITEINVLEISRSTNKVFVEFENYSTQILTSKKDYDTNDTVFRFFKIQKFDYYDNTTTFKISRDINLLKYNDGKKRLIKSVE